MTEQSTDLSDKAISDAQRAASKERGNERARGITALVECLITAEQESAMQQARADNAEMKATELEKWRDEPARAQQITALMETIVRLEQERDIARAHAERDERLNDELAAEHEMLRHQASEARIGAQAANNAMYYAIKRERESQERYELAMLQIRDAHNALHAAGIPCEPHEPHEGCQTQLGHRVRDLTARVSSLLAAAKGVVASAGHYQERTDWVFVSRAALDTGGGG